MTVNAVEDCVASESDSASEGRSAPSPAPIAGVIVKPLERPGRSVEGRLLARLLAFLGDPPLEFILWTGERVPPAAVAPVARIQIADRAALFGLLADPQIKFGEA